MSGYELEPRSDYEPSKSSRNAGIAIAMITIAVAIVGAAALFMISDDQTQQASLPDRDVEVVEGQMPKLEVEQNGEGTDVSLPAIELDTQSIDVANDRESVTISIPENETDIPDRERPSENPSN